MSKQFDVVIIGGGLVGASLANALHGFNGKVALIDRNDLLRPNTFNPPLRAIALSEGSRNILETIGVWDSVNTYTSPIQQIIVSERNAFGVTHIDAQQEGIDAVGYVVTNVNLLRAMYKANGLQSPSRSTKSSSPLINNPTCHVFHSTIVTDVVRNDEWVDVIFDSGNGQQKIQTKLLVLSDGGASVLSTRLEFETNKRDYHQTALLMSGYVKADNHTTVYERFSDGTLLVALPLDVNKSQFALTWIMKNDRYEQIKDLDIVSLQAVIQQGFGAQLQIEHLDEQRFSYPLQLSHVPCFANDRVVLLGDAAHKIHPFGAQGFNLSLRDVGFLVQCLENCQDAGASDLLNQYIKLRSNDIQSAIRFTDTLARLIVCSSSTMSALRGLGLAVFDALPPFRRMVVRRGLGLSGPYSRLACGIPLQR